MKAEDQLSVIEEVRAMKEANAEEHGYSVRAIIEAARKRQESSGHCVLRMPMEAWRVMETSAPSSD